MNSNQAVKFDIEDLPGGYDGLLFVVGPTFEAGIYEPMNELIAPGSTAHGKDHETIWAFVWPTDNQYKCCGWFSFDCLPDRIIPDNADVALAHRRRGIASSVYRFVRRVTDVDLIPSSVQTPAAVSLWKSLASSLGKL